MDRLPEYLRYTVYGQIVERHLEQRSPPNWVRSALIYQSATYPTSGANGSNGPNGIDASTGTMGSIGPIGAIGAIGAIDTSTCLEKVPTSEETDHMALPTAWNTRGTPDLAINGDTVRVSGDISENKDIYLRANRRIPQNCGTWYFEVTLDPSSRASSPSLIGMNLGGATSRPVSMAGTQNTCWLYFSDDGKIMADSASSAEFGPVYGPGDTVGCGVNYDSRSIFYTRNGIRVCTAFKSLASLDLYPFVGVRAGTIFSTNFGQREFKFDIADYVLSEKNKLYTAIDATKIHKSSILGDIELAAPVPSLIPHTIASEPVSRLVQNYLEAMSYTKSLAALERQLDPQSAAGTPQEPVPRGSVMFRAQVSSAIIDQDFDSVLRLLRESEYASVLDEQLQFDIDCLRMAKAVRQDDLDGAIDIAQTLKYRCTPTDTTRKAQLQQLFGVLAYPRDAPAPYEEQMYGAPALAELSTRVIGMLIEADGDSSVAYLPHFMEKVATSIEAGAELGRGGNLNGFRDFC